MRLLANVMWCYGMAGHRWVENLWCPNCRKTGVVRFSVANKYSWDARIDSVPEGFKVAPLESGSNFYCASCSIPADPYFAPQTP
jgi:hypothetical protein